MRDQPAQLAPLAAVFAINGALYGSLLPRYPQIADQVGASAGQFGLALAGIGVGGVTGAFVATRAIRAIGGPRRALLVAGTAFLAAGLAVAAAPSLALLTLAFAALGLFDGFVDTAMNQAGAAAGQRVGASVMGRLHASLAAATLVATGVGAAVAATVGVGVHLAVVAAVLLVVLLVALRPLPAATSPTAPQAEARSSAATGQAPAGGRGRPVRRAWWWAVVVIAGLAAVLIELPAQEWSGLLLAREMSASPTVAGAGPLVAVAGVLAGRLVLDGAVDAFGWTTVARAAGALAAVATIAGLALGAVTGQPLPLLVGLGLAAVGAGAAVPLLFDRAGHLAARVGLAADAGPGLVSGVFRLGVLVSPLAVGAIATSAGLFLALGVTAAAGATIAALAGLLTRDHPR